jgi:hypothetical protein
MVCSGQDGGVKIEVQERYTSRTHFSTVYRKTEYRFSFLSFFLSTKVGWDPFPTTRAGRKARILLLPSSSL